MAVILPNSMILHIPKTGGQFVRDVLNHNKIAFYETGRRPCGEPGSSQRLFNWGFSSHCLPIGAPEFRARRGASLVFVRHPAEWYRSYWAYRISNKPGRVGANPVLYWRTSDAKNNIGKFYAEVDEKTHSDDFGEWIENVLREFPNGAYSQFCKYYISFASEVGKTENLKGDLTKFLYIHEGIKDLDFDIPKSNTTKGDYKSKAIYAPGQKARIEKAEKWIIDNYYT